ncbi:MAG: isoaspartyl peptidase/L-asparaginase [Bacteroidetes bacterium]|nr:isoaspartyl peptidase/L-asparaginase [Bacteroidota bacterium]
MSRFAIAVHGGAGTILKSSMTSVLESQYLKGLEDALKSGYEILKKGGSSIDAVEAATISLENFPMFNSGKGSVFNHEGKHEMDASIMEGQFLDAGAISGVSGIKNPIALARLVMEKTEHVYLSGEGAINFAKKIGVKIEEEDYFFNEFRYQQWLDIKDSGAVKLDHSDKKFGTVGAVALDINGNLAAATSTGGMTNKQFGRVGDSSIIGAGTYANNKTCAISCTGHGELFIRSVVAYDISCLMEYKGLSLKEACDIVVHDKLVKIGGEGGLIAIDALGKIELPFNSEGMYRGFVDTQGILKCEIYK